ncbi:endonuclease/exonuclease/phosphatase family protein [Streptomyces olivochromogenes]|uniref:endonuclease/exonuclease/phosphatase family protein n=1 Tax=Streptomyces olivochromogenes TaxID=1963 RepID=UPI0036DEBF00
MDGGPATIGLTSMNVCCGISSTLPPPKERAVEFCRRIEESGVDVVSFQEVWTAALFRTIRTHLPSYPFVARATGVAGQPAGGLASFSRLPLRSVSYESFRGSRPAESGPLFRGSRALWGRLQGVLTFELAGRRTLVGNVHLTANKDGDWSVDNRHHRFQRRQLAMFHRTLQRARQNDTELMIAGGDLNIPDSSPLYPLVVDEGAWRDPFRAVGRPTFHTDLLPPGASAHRVDYLLVAGDAERYPVTEPHLLFTDPVQLGGRKRSFLSDHVALTARIALPTASSVS